uniref:Solute carrier family 43 member 3-like n=1 Tax=Heterorhabditis bacteriophora TaxID=37862 RepID=A0A1I7XAC0_HETBA
MKLMWCIFIEEKETRVCSVRISNRPLAAFLASLQLTVALASLFQVRYLAYDIIIFDFGLMRRVLGTEECVANYLGLLLQSSYSLGLSVLTMATAPKLLEALGGRVDFHLATMFIIYISGCILVQLGVHFHPMAPLLVSGAIILCTSRQPHQST